MTSGSATTTLPNDLLFGVLENDEGSPTSTTTGTNYSNRSITNISAANEYQTEDRVGNLAGSYSATWTYANAYHYVAGLVAFKAAPVAPQNSVLGQSGAYNSASGGATSSQITSPGSSAVDALHHRLFIAESFNNRVLEFDLDSTNNLIDGIADHVLGQTTFTGTGFNTTQSTMKAPKSVAYDPYTDALYVADSGNSRVLVYLVATITDGMNASYVLGHTLYTTSTTASTQNGFNAADSVSVDSGGSRLFVGDGPNNRRVLVFNTLGLSNGQNAAYVIGQTNFTNNTSGTTQAKFSNEAVVSFDRWNNYLYVADTFNNRVMVFDASALSNGMNASAVLGQTLYTTSATATTQAGLNGPYGVEASQNAVYVADSGNNRVLGFAKGSFTNGEGASVVYGQPGYQNAAYSTTQFGLQTPTNVRFDPNSGRLFVADYNNSRIVTYNVETAPSSPTSLTQYKSDGTTVVSAGGWDNSLTVVFKAGVYDPDATDTVSLCVEVQPITTPFTNIDVACGTGASNGGTGSVTVSGATEGAEYHWQARTKDSWGVYSPWVAYGNNADTNPAATDVVTSVGIPADNVLGQAGSFTTSTGTATATGESAPDKIAIDSVHHRMFVGDGGNHRVLVYNLDSSNNLIDTTADFVLGQSSLTTFGAAATQGGMHDPEGVAYDAINDRLYVADVGNNRVLVFNTSTITNGMNAANVLGQTTFTASGAATTQSGLSAPAALSYDSGNQRLFVGDYNNYRVIVYNTSSITNGMNAAYVIGQSTFGTATNASTQAGLGNVSGVSYDSSANYLYASDYTHSRVMVYNLASIANGLNASYVLGQSNYTNSSGAVTLAGLSYPGDVDATSNTIYVANAAGHRVTGYPKASLATGMNATSVYGEPNYTTSTGLTTRSGMNFPYGVTFDTSSGHLYVADSSNSRVLVFNADQAPTISSLAQYKSDGTTSLSVGASTNNSTTVIAKATVADADATDTDQLCVEIKPVNTAFSNIDTACGTGVSPGATASVSLTSLVTGTQYHWQARTKDSFGTYSAWSSFGGNSDTVTAATDVAIAAPPNAPTNLAQTKTTTTGIPGTTLYTYDASTGGSFEANGGTLTVDTTTKRTGAGSMKDTIAGNGVFVNDGNSSTRDMSSGGNTFSTWMYVPGANSGSGWVGYITVYAPGGTYISGPSVTLVRDSWTLVTFTPPPNLLASMTYIALAASGGSGGTNSVYFDDVQQGNGIYTNENSVRFTGSVSDADSTDTDQLCIEAQPIATAFTNTEQSCGTGVAYSGTPVAALNTLASLTNGTSYHWQARTKDAAGLYSSWVQYGGNAESGTTAPDFIIDTTVPATGTAKDGPSAGVDVNYNTGALDTLSGNWSGFSDGGAGITRYEYSFGLSAGATTISSGWIAVDNATTAVTKAGLSLKTGTVYYFNVRAVDGAGNTSSIASTDGQQVAPTLTFATSLSTLNLGHLNAGNSYTATSALNVITSTNAYNGYVIRQYAPTPMTSGSTTIPAYSGTYASPTTWSGNGSGYTTNDTSIQAAGNPFATATKYAAIASSGPGDIVADHVATVTGTPITSETFTLTYKLAATSTQAAGSYSTILSRSHSFLLTL